MVFFVILFTLRFASLILGLCLAAPGYLNAEGFITTIAGCSRPAPVNDSRAVDFQFDGIVAVTTDREGNVYASDHLRHQVYRIDKTGQIRLYAGSGLTDSTGDGGAATEAALNQPWALATDTEGNLYISEFRGERIRKVTRDGRITTVAGSTKHPRGNLLGDRGPASDANLFELYGIAVDGKGQVFAAMQQNRVRRIGADGMIYAVAGDGSGRFSGDGGLASQSGINHPHGMAVDSAGNLYFADRNNNRIRKISPQGIITTVAGGGQGALGDGGPALNASLTLPSGVAVDGAGNLYIADTWGNRVRKVTAQGIITTIAGDGQARFNGEEGIATSLSLSQPHSVAVDSIGNVYVADIANRRVRVITPAGQMRTIAGNGKSFFSGDGGPATEALFDQPASVTTDPAGNIYVADTLNNRIRKIDTNGIVQTIAGNGKAEYSGDGGPATEAGLNWPAYVRLDGQGNLYIADMRNQRIRKVSPSGVISTIAGNGQGGAVGDGVAATQAHLVDPVAVAISNRGEIFIADRSNRIRKIDANGILSTVVGNGVAGFAGDGGLATSASINRPSDMGFDAAGNLYIVDSVNFRVRRIDLNGVIQTIAGSGCGCWSGNDVESAITNLLDFPTGIGVQPDGNLFVAGTNSVFRVSKTGIFSVIVNDRTDSQSYGYGEGFRGDGGPSRYAHLIPDQLALSGVGGRIAVAPDGSILYADNGNNRIRRVTGVSSPAMLKLSARVSGFNNLFGPNRTVTLESVEGGPLEWKATVSTDSGQDWLSVSPSSGTTPATITVRAAFDRMPNQFEFGRVIVSAPDSNNGPLTFRVYGENGGPLIDANSAVNGASYEPVLTPGSLATVFGRQLSQNVTGVHSADSLPFPPVLEGSSVLVNETYASLIDVVNVNGQEQINFQVPWEVTGDQGNVVVTHKGMRGAVTVPLRISKPGIFSWSDGLGVIVHPDGALVTAESPAIAGEVLTLYGTGFGPVFGSVRSGEAADAAPLPSTKDPVGVRMAGLSTEVFYAGLTPLSVGLYQINFKVPQNVPGGRQRVIVTSADGAASQEAMIWLR
jgi:uncharacterized protein (TIGR03437 family)